MKKYAINYNRKFPDHRVEYDFQYYQRLKRKPLLDILKLMRSSFFYQIGSNTPMYMSVASLVFLTFYGVYKYRDKSEQDVICNIKNYPGLKYHQWVNTDKGKFDTILRRFENEPYGKKDLSFTD